MPGLNLPKRRAVDAWPVSESCRAICALTVRCEEMTSDSSRVIGKMCAVSGAKECGAVRVKTCLVDFVAILGLLKVSLLSLKLMGALQCPAI